MKHNLARRLSVSASCQRDGFLDILYGLVLLQLFFHLLFELNPGLDGVAVLPDVLVDHFLLQTLHLHRTLFGLKAGNTN